MKDKITYDSLMRDDEFLRDAYKALQAQGINVSKQRGDILDRMLTNKRYFDTNVASTFVIGDNVKDTFLDIRRMPSNIRKTTNVFEHFERKNIC